MFSTLSLVWYGFKFYKKKCNFLTLFSNPRTKCLQTFETAEKRVRGFLQLSASSSQQKRRLDFFDMNGLIYSDQVTFIGSWPGVYTLKLGRWEEGPRTSTEKVKHLYFTETQYSLQLFLWTTTCSIMSSTWFFGINTNQLF